MDAIVPKVVYLHSNLVESSVVGDRFQNIIKIFPMQKDKLTLDFDRVDFFSMKTNGIENETVHFEFRDQNGALMLIKKNPSIQSTIITIIFRKCMKRKT